NAILEYMVAGRPIVATNVGGIPELIQNRQSGILVGPESTAELADGIKLLLNDTQLAADLAKTAYREARAVYDINRIAKLHIELYQNISDVHE
ncbi:MAG: glycosyltransferase family 4 protein, partial [Hyphomicrobiales bacterium]|nr:glycosyltransferase family 4 protein [Hyphomicrobiales bacterium]